MQSSQEHLAESTRRRPHGMTVSRWSWLQITFHAHVINKNLGGCYHAMGETKMTQLAQHQMERKRCKCHLKMVLSNMPQQMDWSARATRMARCDTMFAIRRRETRVRMCSMHVLRWTVCECNGTPKIFQIDFQSNSEIMMHRRDVVMERGGPPDSLIQRNTFGRLQIENPAARRKDGRPMRK